MINWNQYIHLRFVRFILKSWFELDGIKSIVTWFWSTMDLWAQPTGLMNIIELHQYIGVGRFENLDLQI